MIYLNLEREPRLTESIIQRALAAWVGWFRKIVVPNWCYYHEMDLAVLTQAGYLWEFEIKVSQADWNGDRKKDEPNQRWVEWSKKTGQAIPPSWAGPRRDLDRARVKRFYYAYAEGLRCPEWVPEWAGLVEVVIETRGGSVLACCHERRAATNRRVQPLEPRAERKLLESVYHRYWGRVMDMGKDRPSDWADPLSNETEPDEATALASLLPPEEEPNE